MTGRVLDETKAGVPGATVIVKGSTRGVITGNDGTFSIDVKPTDVIEISYLGYETQSIPVGTKTNIVTELVRKVSELEAVTVVAYGKQRKESIIGAINTIDAGELEVASGSLSSNLAGKLAGIVVMQRTGEPGSSAEFWIRGQSTFGAKTTPLVLVDGIERDMDFVDADDIATFSILKDATATALYGVRGANGIILITTKRGTEMTAPQIRVKAEFGITQPVQLPELANASQWIDYYNELYRDSGSTEMPISDYARQMYLSGRDPDLYPNVDWVNTIFKDLAMTGRVHASVTGGSPKIRYYVSASYYTEGGMFNVADNERYNAQMNFNKYSFRSNIDIDITKSTQLGLSLSTQYTTKNAPCTTTNDLYAYTMYVTPVATPTVFSNGMLAIPQESGSVNPYNMLNNTGYRRYNTMVAQSLLSLTQDFSDIITPGLKANVKFAWDAQNATLLERAMSPVTYYATGRDENGELMLTAANPNGSNYMRLATSDSSGTTAINFEGSLIYERLFAEDHRVSGMFLYSVRSKSKNRPVNYIDAYPTKNMGIAGRFTYAFRDKYFAEFNFGYNGSENFAPGKRYGFFPSFSAAYRISEEPFFEPLRKAVDNLKIRLSYGSLGNQQIGYYDFIQTITTKGSMSDYSFDGTVLGQHATVSDPVSGDQTWEKVVSKNLGLDLNMFNNRLSLTTDFYIRDTKGILGKGKSLPSIYGASEPQMNANNLRTKGYELVLGWRDSFKLAGSTFSYGITGTFSDYTAEYTKCDNPTGLIGDPYVGKKYGEIWGYKVDGLFRNDKEAAEYASRIDLSTVASGYYTATGAYGKGVRGGDIKYLDLNGDNIVNGGKGTLDDPGDRRVIGNSSPRYQYGASLNFSWYGFDVSVFMQGIGRLDWYPGADNLRFWGPYCRPYATFVPKNFMSQVWSEENPDAYFPRARAYTSLNSNSGTAYYTNDRYLQNLAYCRLKNLTIGYTIPRRLTSKVGIKECRIYFSGENLATWSALKSDFLDPEQAAADSDKKANVYPWCKTYSIGLNLTF